MDNNGGCKRYRSVKSANVTGRNTVNSKPKVRWGATSAKTSRNRQINSEDSIPVAPYITHGWGEWCDSEGSDGKEEEESFSVRDRFHRKVLFNNMLRYPLMRDRVCYSAPLNITTLLSSKPNIQVQGHAYCMSENKNHIGPRGFKTQFPVRRDARSIINQTYEWVPQKGELEEEDKGVKEKLELSLVNIEKKKKKKKERKVSQVPITGRAGLLALHFDPKLSHQTLQISSLIAGSVRKKKAPPTPAPSPPAPSPLFDCSAVITK